MGEKGKRKRLLAMLMAISLLIADIPLFPGMTRVHAEPEGGGEKTVTGLGTACISGPSIPSDATDPWKGSYVYFGMYDRDTEDEEEAYPVKYRVLSGNTTRFSEGSGKHTMFLDCDTILYRVRFDDNGGANPGAQKANEWAFSNLWSSLNKGETSFLYRGFSAAERGAIAESTIAAHPLKSSVSYDKVSGDELNCDEIGADEVDVPYQIKIDYADYVALSEDRIFVLDAEDAVNPLYGYFSTLYDTQTRVKTYENAKPKEDPIQFWWLRSAGTHERLFHGVGSVMKAGQISWLDSYCPYAGVSPALNIDLSCVVFSSLIPSESAAGNTYKLTISDNDLMISATDVTSDGDNVTLSYTISDDSDLSAPTQVSLVVTDGTWTENGWSEGARLIHYEKIRDIDETGPVINGTASFALNNDWNDGYHYYIVAEDVKGGLQTDIASRPVEISFSKCAQTVNAPAAVAGLKYNGTLQKLVSPAVVVKGNKAPGSIEYSLDNTSWSSAIPTGTDAGDYSIYWRVAGNSGFNAFVSDRPVSARIAEADPVTPSGPDDKEVVTPVPDDKDVVIPVPDDKDRPLPDKSEEAMSPVPRVDHEAAYQWIYLVKGQKFTDEMFKGWTVDDANRKNISVSKKGVVNAKKITEKAVLTSPDKTKTVSVNICHPSVIKKLKLEAGVSEDIVIKDKNENLAVLWVSSNPDAATVDRNGHVVAIAKGKAVITAYINGKAYKCTLTVTETAAAASRVVHLNIGGTKKISLKGVKKYQWSISGNGTDILKPLKGNKFKGQAAGVVSLNTVDPKTNKVYTATVYVEDITIKTDGITAGRKNKYSIKMKAGETKEIKFANVQQPVLFKSSKPEYVYATGSGVIRAVKKGKGKLTAKINGKTVTINVVVEQ